MNAEAPTNASIRRDAALRDVRADYFDRKERLLADLRAAEREIDRRFWAGEFAQKEAA